jgi:hypothetical protein
MDNRSITFCLSSDKPICWLANEPSGEPDENLFYETDIVLFCFFSKNIYFLLYKSG